MVKLYNARGQFPKTITNHKSKWRRSALRYAIMNASTTGELKLVTFPGTPGSDVAGVVVAVGDECERIRVDDCVCDDDEQRGRLR